MLLESIHKSREKLQLQQIEQLHAAKQEGQHEAERNGSVETPAFRPVDSWIGP